MGWSKVKSKKNLPLGWWYHKLMCEFGYLFNRKSWGLRMYYRHLNKMCNKYKINLYGKEF